MKSDNFEEYFRALHGIDPFPWQKRLSRLVCETNTWPRVIDLPTGAGKTACIDIALFHLLVSTAAERPNEAARRVAFVVDRRIIVDEAASRAIRISGAIRDAKDGILREAATLISKLSGQTEIQVMTLRGGVPREKNLVRDPTTVAVVLSTVDQLGSRLLFRGYGVSDFAKPMHAGMFGFDTLLLLDEAHIAEPFQQTLRGLEREQGRATSTALGVRPLRWSQLSATPSVRADFSIDDADERDPVLQLRLQAKKPMRLLNVLKRDELAKKVVELVKAELSAPEQSALERPRIGIVVNRVVTAREIHSVLARTLKDTAEVHLLIGRIRPIDRDRLMRNLTPALKSSSKPRPGERPIVIVATQTIEVGADFDFHTMLIEAASYPAIRQRVGRLNRLGVRESARGALILVKSDAEDDPVYGSTIANTWNLLEQAASEGCVDLGIARAPEALAGTAPPSPATPQLSPSLLNLLAQTSPRPAIEPDVSHFLHGFMEQAPDVTVVWREGIYGSNGNVDEAIAAGILEALPPLAVEGMSLPLSSFRSWLRARIAKKPSKQVDAGDLEGDVLSDEDEGGLDAKVVVIDDNGARAITISEVQPGSMIVVPCHWGGTDTYGFAPESTVRVEDLSLDARERSQRAATLAFTPEIARSWAKNELADSEKKELFTGARRMIQKLEEEDLTGTDARAEVSTWIDSYSSSLRADIYALWAELSGAKSMVDSVLDALGGLHGIIVRARRPKAGDLSDDTIGLQRTVDVGLDEHCCGVAAYAERFARSIGFANSVVDDLRLAGRLHDLGKADPRFQAMLGADGSRLLAKGSSFDRRVVLGARHECYSVALVDRYPSLIAMANDAELVRYLIGTHHGRGRGVQPVVDDVGASFELDFEGATLTFRGRAELFPVDSGWAELFGRLQRRYGVWGLAYLETVLRLADHRRSEAEIEKSFQEISHRDVFRSPLSIANGIRGSKQLNTLELNGLIGSHPLGALAAFGLLRVIASQGGDPRLYFVERDDWVARIECEHTSADALIEALVDWIRSRREELLSWTSNDLRVPLEEYRSALEQALLKNDDLPAFLSALAADGAVDKSKGLIKPTAFYMASGQQSFLETMEAILLFVREAPTRAWSEALVGPWTYSAPIWGAGWDPGTERMHALRHKAPTKDKTSCVAGAVWLAFEALPLFPSFSRGGRDRTVGFVHHDRARHWRWPVPTRPASLDSLSALVSSREVALAPKLPLRSGIGAVYESTRHEFGQGYAVFRPSRRIA